MTNADALDAASNFDRLPEDAIVDTKTALIILGGTQCEYTLRTKPPITRRQISQRRSRLPRWRSSRADPGRNSTERRMKRDRHALWLAQRSRQQLPLWTFSTPPT